MVGVHQGLLPTHSDLCLARRVLAGPFPALLGPSALCLPSTGCSSLSWVSRC